MRRETDEMNLTAYALGELEGAERAGIEARLAGSAADRQFVADVRAAARAITDELAREETNGLDAIHYAAIEMRLRGAAGPRAVDRRAIVRARVGLALSLAAAIAIVAGVVGMVLFALSRHEDVAVAPAQTQPAVGQPILVPMETFPPDRATFAGPGAPAGAELFVSVADHPVSSFALDVDTASYDELRRALFDHRLPSRDSVKIEGLVNAFAYDDPAPAPGAVFGARIEVGQCPWRADHRLARVTIKARAGEGTVAQDARTEVAFNPQLATSYRLLGYDDDATAAPRPATAGERVEAGRSVVALYEVVPARRAGSDTDLLTLRVRFRAPGGEVEQTLQFAGRDRGTMGDAESPDFRFAAAVAEFGMILRDPTGPSRPDIGHVIALAEAARGSDKSAERKQFIDLARRAKELLG